MLTSRLFWKIFAPYAVLSLVAAAAFVGIQSSRQRGIVIDQVRQRLHDSAAVLRSRIGTAFEQDNATDLQEVLVRLGRETDTRLTLVAEDGIVVADSAEDPAQMENHRNRGELIQARHHGMGESQRTSPTLGIPMMYVALRVGSDDEPIGFVRVAMPMESVNAQVASVQRLIWGTAAMISFAALVFTCVIAVRVVRPVTRLTKAAEAIADGDLRQMVDVPQGDELGTLGAAFNSMSSELASRVDELQRSRRELQENSELLETVLGTMIEGVIAIDRSQHVLFANHAARRLLEFATADVVGRPVWESARHPTIQDVVRSVLEKGTTQRAEFEIPRTKSTVALVATPLPGDQCAGAVLVLHDITELRRLENLRRDFVANVSHELKTPLTSIQAYTETLLEGAIDDPSHNRRFLCQIGEQADHLHALILDMLRLARIESEEAVFEVAPVPVGECADDCISEYRTVAASKQISLYVEPPPVEIRVLADADELCNILSNLVDNAIKYTSAGGRVTLRWSTESTMARIDVTDTGIGIAPEHHGRIFERFYRVDRARSRELGGTGLGLAIVKHLARDFGGRVDVSSQIGEGTIFTVWLPLATDHPAVS